jgi:hypothetical protein
VTGVAAAVGGIRSITVNGEPATLTPLTSDMVVFVSPRFTLPSGATEMNVTATANNNSATDFAFNLMKPEIQLKLPFGDTQTRQEAISLQGSVQGLSNVDRVEIEGKPVALKESPDGNLSFDVPAVPLSLGTNAITGFVLQDDGEHRVFYSLVHRNPPQKALSIDQVVNGLRGQISNTVMTRMVQERGVDFEVTPSVEKRLRGAGANDELLDAISQTSR